MDPARGPYNTSRKLDFSASGSFTPSFPPCNLQHALFSHIPQDDDPPSSLPGDNNSIFSTPDPLFLCTCTPIHRLPPVTVKVVSWFLRLIFSICPLESFLSLTSLLQHHFLLFCYTHPISIQVCLYNHQKKTTLL